jgi:hypothetical protein
MAVIEIPDEFSNLRFEGEKIGGPVTTAFDHTGAQRPRWLEAVAYERADGGFIVAQANYSLVWHQPDAPAGHIRSPGPLAFAALPGQAVYCADVPAKPGRETCPPIRPPRDPFSAGPGRTALLARPETVLTELPQRKILRARGWEDLIRKISTSRSRAGGSTVSLSMPMRQLIAEIARNRPELAARVTMDL